MLLGLNLLRGLLLLTLMIILLVWIVVPLELLKSPLRLHVVVIVSGLIGDDYWLGSRGLEWYGLARVPTDSTAMIH